MNQKIMNAVVI